MRGKPRPRRLAEAATSTMVANVEVFCQQLQEVANQLMIGRSVSTSNFTRKNRYEQSKC